MKTGIDFTEARKLLISLVNAVDICKVGLDKCGGRILAEQLLASENVPAFDRSPYDGYAFRAEDTRTASGEQPVKLQVIEEIPAGSTASKKVTEGTAVKILTGAPIPEGADCVIMYEKTEFTAESVSIFAPCVSGDNIIHAGEDVKKGAVLAAAGQQIDPGLAASLAGQRIARPSVYRIPVVGIISTGSELVEIDPLSQQDEISVPEGKIINTNRYMLETALRKDGCEPKYIGTAGDETARIADLIRQALDCCDMVLLTGGVSAGDYDLTPDAMEQAGCELLVKGVGLKPGMACCYGIREGKLVCALSGNPSSSLTNYYAIVRPAVRKMTGRDPFMPEEFQVEIAEGFGKKSKSVRLLKGRLSIEGGKAVMHLPKGQGNVIISSSIGCDVIAIVPEGSGKVEAGTKLTAFRV